MLEALGGDAPQLAVAQLLADIRALGRVPRAVRGSGVAEIRERSLATRLRRARKAGSLNAEFQQELAEMRVRDIGELEEATAPPDPFDAFADEAEN
eukprot:14046273-Alexandrium_andersonii.AAC.1